MTPQDLARMAAPLVALLLPGWSITWECCAPEDIGGNLAMIYPTPTRSMALIKVAPHPPGEDPLESIAHELVHGVLSPLTALLPASAGSIMLEEQAVERLGVALAKMPPGLARAIGRAVDRYAPRVRARVSARASRSRKGRAMDPKMLMEALDALIAQDTEKCMELLKALVAGSQAGKEPDGDEGAPARADDPAKPEAGPPAPDARGGYAREDEPPMARGRKALDEAGNRARRVADKLAQGYARSRVADLQRQGWAIDAKLEAELVSMTDDVAFDRRVADLERGRAMASAGGQRARSGVQTDPAPAPGDGDPKDPDDLKTFDDAFQATYRGLAKSNKAQAELWLGQGRARKARDGAQGRN